jgi:hypothetical protein
MVGDGRPGRTQPRRWQHDDDDTRRLRRMDQAAAAAAVAPNASSAPTSGTSERDRRGQRSVSSVVSKLGMMEEQWRRGDDVVLVDCESVFCAFFFPLVPRTDDGWIDT